jgi:hypothetical protein
LRTSSTWRNGQMLSLGVIGLLTVHAASLPLLMAAAR